MHAARPWSRPPVRKEKGGDRMKGSGLQIQIEVEVGKGKGSVC